MKKFLKKIFKHSKENGQSDIDKLRKEASKKEVIFRSCWNCNPAHEHLKKADYVIFCLMGCGHYYYKGQDITIFDDKPKDE